MHVITFMYNIYSHLNVQTCLVQRGSEYCGGVSIALRSVLYWFYNMYMIIKDAPELLAAGQWVWRLPRPPSLPRGACPKLAIACASSVR